jgi:tRNA-specific 2-thiouridylase
LLLKGVDAGKDQSYVLHVLTQDKLKKALFPVGDYPKTEIRRLAAEFNLPVANRHDSQDLCFLAGEDYRTFILRNRPEMNTSGPIVGRDGRVLGEHIGLSNYTIGQRKGLGIASSVPLYVIAKDSEKNTLVVGKAHDLGAKQLLAVDVNWTCAIIPDAPFRATVKSRYTSREAPAEITPLESGSKVRVVFDDPQRDLTPGQAAVIYNGDVVWGGGLIKKVDWA